MTYPVAEYDHTDPSLVGRAAATGVVVYRSPVIPQLTGRILWGDMPKARKPMRMHSKGSVLATLAAAAVIASTASCGVFGSDDDGRRIGVISHYSDPVVIDVPTTVRTGEMFEVRVRTYGGGCIRQGDTSTQVDGMRAGVTPYDIDSGASTCTDQLRTFEHTARLRFDGAGPAVITVRGRRLPEDEIVIIERQLVVQ